MRDFYCSDYAHVQKKMTTTTNGFDLLKVGFYFFFLHTSKIITSGTILDVTESNHDFRSWFQPEPMCTALSMCVPRQEYNAAEEFQFWSKGRIQG